MICSGLTDQPEREGTVDSRSRSGDVDSFDVAHRTDRKSDSIRRCERSPQRRSLEPREIGTARKPSRIWSASLSVSATPRDVREDGVRVQEVPVGRRLARFERAAWGAGGRSSSRRIRKEENRK